MFEEISAKLRSAAAELLGEKPVEKALKAVRKAYPLASTGAAVELARKIMRMIRSEKNRALQEVEEAAGKGSTANFGFRQDQPQSLLFDEKGAVTPEGDPRLMHPELEALNRNARCLSALADKDSGIGTRTRRRPFA